MKNSRYMVLFAAIIVAAGLGLYYLNTGTHVNGKDAEGAIGAVEKHRAEQIKPSDVVLGDEQFRQEEESFYGGLLNDAAQLEVMSASIANFGRDMEVKADTLDLFKKDLQSLDRDLASRYADVQNGTLGLIRGLENEDQLAAFHAEIQAMGRDVEAFSKLEVLSKLELQKLEVFERDLGRISADIAARADLAASLDKMTQDMQGMVSRIEVRNDDLKMKDLQVMEADLQKMSEDLKLQKGLELRALENRLNRVESRFQDLALISRTRDQLQALNRIESFSQDQLAARQEDMLGLSRDVVALAASLEVRAMDNMQVRFQQVNLRAEQIAGLRHQLEILSKDVQVKQASLDARGFDQAVEVFDKALGARYDQLASRYADSMQAELGAISRHFDSHAQLEQRYAATLGIKQAEMQNRLSREMQARGYVADLQVFQNHLEALDRDLKGAGFVQAEIRSQLNTKAQDLRSRVQDM